MNLTVKRYKIVNLDWLCGDKIHRFPQMSVEKFVFKCLSTTGVNEPLFVVREYQAEKETC